MQTRILCPWCHAEVTMLYPDQPAACGRCGHDAGKPRQHCRCTRCAGPAGWQI